MASVFNGSAAGDLGGLNRDPRSQGSIDRSLKTQNSKRFVEHHFDFRLLLKFKNLNLPSFDVWNGNLTRLYLHCTQVAHTSSWPAMSSGASGSTQSYFREGGNHLKVGIFGYPNVGKSCLFNVLSASRTAGSKKTKALVGDFLFTTVGES